MAKRPDAECCSAAMRERDLTREQNRQLLKAVTLLTATNTALMDEVVALRKKKRRRAAT